MSRHSNAGFTLLEVVVSLAISALALASLTHLVHDAASLDARLSERQRAAGEAGALFTLLEELLDGPRLEPTGTALQLADGPKSPSVSGTGKSITVLSRGPRVLGLTEPRPFTLHLESGGDPDDGRILLDWSTGASGSEPETLTRARAFTVRYAAKTDAQLEWSDEWSRPVNELAMIEAGLVEIRTGRRVSRLIPVVPSLPRICVLQPLLEGCPPWH